MKIFSFVKIFIEAVGPHPNAPNLQKVSNFTQNLNGFFSWPKFDEGCSNYHMIPVHSRAMSILPSGRKKNDKIVLDYFAIDLTIILPLLEK